MVVLYVLGGLLLFLFLLTLVPVRADIRFQEKFFLEVQYLFLRFPLLPGAEKLEQEKKEPAEKREGPSMGEKLKKMWKREGASGFLQSFYDFIKMVKDSSVRLFSHIKLRRFDLYYCVGGGADAAQGALRYGQVSAGVYSACGFLFCWKKCRKKSVTVDLDYEAQADTAAFSCRVSLLPLFAVKEGIIMLIGALPLLRKLR